MVVFIGGPLGSGKSTVAKILKRKLRKAAIVEPDVLRGFIPDVPIDDAVPLVLDITVLAVRKLASAGFHVIVPYPLSERHHRFVRSRLRRQKLHFFTLGPRMEAIQKGRGKRRLNRWEKQRIRHHYRANLHDPSFGTRIDNTNQSPSETAKCILASLDGY